MKNARLSEMELKKYFDEIAAAITANPNSDGWIRLLEVLQVAQSEKRISTSAGATQFLELMIEIASDSLTAATDMEALLPLIKILESEAQSQRARKPRGKLEANGDTLGSIIEGLAKDDEATAAELWPLLYSELDRLHLSPRELEDFGDPRKTTYTYGGNRHITFGQFANRVSEFRKKSG